MEGRVSTHIVWIALEKKICSFYSTYLFKSEYILTMFSFIYNLTQGQLHGCMTYAGMKDPTQKGPTLVNILMFNCLEILNF